MEKIKPILNIVLKVLFILVLVATTILSLASGYIIFAPDSFPKPFYLVYAYPDGSVSDPPTAASSGGEAQSDHASTSEDASGTHDTTTYNYLPGQGIIMETGAKIINLASSSNRYIRINIALEFAPNDVEAYELYLESQSGGGGSYGLHSPIAQSEDTTGPDYVTAFLEQLSTKQPVIDDIITGVVSSHTYDELYTTEGKETLKQELIIGINQSLPMYKLIAVYFTEFVLE